MTYLFMILAFVTGLFVQYLIILSIVLIHELGHFLMARLLGWRIEKLMLWFFGGVMVTDEHLSRPIYEEFLVVIAGPLQHVFIHIGLFYFGDLLLGEQLLTEAYQYNIWILLFNLIPIWPLDGGKCVQLGLTSLFPFKTAYQAMLIVSLCFIIGILIVGSLYMILTMSGIVLGIFLLQENIVEWKRRHYIFMRFLLNRSQSKQKSRKQIVEVEPSTSLYHVFTLFKRSSHYQLKIRQWDEAVIEENEALAFFFKGHTAQPTIRDMIYFKEMN